MLEQHVGVWGNTVFQQQGGLWGKERSSNFSLDLTLLGCDSFTTKSRLEVERMDEFRAKLFHFRFHQGNGLIFRFISLL